MVKMTIAEAKTIKAFKNKKTVREIVALTGRTRRQVYEISSTLSAVGLRGAARLCAVLVARVCEDLVRVSLKLSVPRGRSRMYLCNFPLFCVLQKKIENCCDVW